LPEECLVFEDSVPGVEAGRRAGMRVCWCPQPWLKEEYSGREGEVLAGLTGEADDSFDKNDPKEKELRGWPSKVGDGWGGEVDSLERFDYGRFGVPVKE